MPQQKNRTIILNILFYFLILTLLYPQTLSVIDTLATSLTAPEYDFITQSESILVLIVMVLETITIVFNILILHWIYKFSNLEYALYENIFIYMFSAFFSKVASLIMPIHFAAFPSIIFSIVFLTLHFKLKDLTKGQLIWIFVFPVLNIIFYIL